MINRGMHRGWYNLLIAVIALSILGSIAGAEKAIPYRTVTLPGTARIERAPLQESAWMRTAPAMMPIGGHQKRRQSLMDCGNCGAQSPRGTGVLSGRVTMGPMSPVEGGGGSPAPAVIPDARLVISGMDGQEVTSVVTDHDGGYSTPLPPGTYRIEMARLAVGGFTKDLPAMVTIIEGQETHLDIRIDTGIR